MKSLLFMTKKRINRFLLESVVNNNIDNVEYLLKKGANINIKNEAENTAVILALEKGYFDIVRLLLDSGADVNIRNNKGYSPLLLSIEKGYKDIVPLILDKHPTFGAQDKSGNSELMLALKNDQLDIVHQLLDSGADVNITNDEGYSPLLLSIEKGYKDIVPLILDKHPNLYYKNKSGETALTIAKEKGYNDIASRIKDISFQSLAEELGKFGGSKETLVKECIELGSDIVPYLLDALNSSKGGGIPDALGALGDKRAVEPLIEAFKNGSWSGYSSTSLVPSSATALGKIDDSRAVAPLMEFLILKDTSTYYKGDVIRALGNMGVFEATPFLEEIMLNTDKSSYKPYIPPELGKAASDALELIKANPQKDRGGNIVKKMLTECSSPPPDIKELKSKKDIKGLMAAIDYRWDKNIQKSAVSALGEIGNSSAIDALILNLKENKFVDDTRNALKNIGKLTLIPLIKALNDSSKNHRIIAYLLGNLADPKAVEPLVIALSDSNLDSSALENVAWALGEIGDKRALSALIETLKYDNGSEEESDELHIAVSEALVKITGKRFGKNYDAWEKWYKNEFIQKFSTSNDKVDENIRVIKEAKLLINQKKYDEAIEILLNTLKSDANIVEARYSLGIAYIKKYEMLKMMGSRALTAEMATAEKTEREGLLNEAELNLKQVLEQNPNHLMASELIIELNVYRNKSM